MKTETETKQTQEQKPDEIVTSYPPEIITVTITEEDRQMAGDYLSINNCILCTALKRMGFSGVSAGGLASGGLVGIDNYELYEPLERPKKRDPFCEAWLATGGNGYDLSIVGTAHTFIRK